MLLFHDITNIQDFNLDNILTDEKSHKNILVYNISCKNLINVITLRIRCNKIDRFIRSYDGTRYLVLFGNE